MNTTATGYVFRFLAVLGTTLIVSTPSVHAGLVDGALLHGTECRAYYGSQQGDMQSSPYGLRNASSQTRYVTCPLHRDTFGIYNQNFTIYPRVYNAGGTFTCLSYAISSSGSITDSRGDSTTLTGNRSFDITIKPGGYEYMSMMCLVPPNSYIRGIYVSEPQQ